MFDLKFCRQQQQQKFLNNSNQVILDGTSASNQQVSHFNLFLSFSIYGKKKSKID
jgi:hypothetical protein